jgi:hypothetical protein
MTGPVNHCVTEFAFPRLMKPERKLLILSLTTGPAFALTMFHLVALIYRQQLSTITIPGYLYFCLLSLAPFLAPILGSNGIRNEQSEEEKALRLKRCRVYYKTAAIFTFALFLWAGYAEEGPRNTGKAPKADVVVLLTSLPLAFAVAVAGRLEVRKVKTTE